jgi:hypothetical protein
METLFETAKNEFTFSDKKAVFFNKYNGIFDTPKKLNRSGRTVPETYIEQIEAGECSSATILELQILVPIFTYKTCITIHGNLPEIGRTHIGGYKNLIQNGNGSLEIRWSAIDYKAKKMISKYLRIAGNWGSREDSTNGIYFEKYAKTEILDDAKKLLSEYRAEAERLNIAGLTAKYHVSGYQYFGRYYIYLTVFPLSVTGSPSYIAGQLSGKSENELIEKHKAEGAEQVARENEYKAQREISETKKANAMAEAIKQVEKLQKTKIEATIGKVYLVPVVSTDYRPAYRFYKVSEKGTFGRVKVETYLSLITDFDATKLQPYMKGKQVKASEITTKQVYLIHS